MFSPSNYIVGHYSGGRCASNHIQGYSKGMSTHLEDFFQRGRHRNFLAGEVILNGVEASGAFFIDQGFVKVYSIGDDGSQYLHIIYKRGEIFPLIWILKNIKRRVFYESISDVTVYEVDKPAFLVELKRNTGLSHETLQQLAEQFYMYADRLDNLQYKSAYERVVYRLLFLAGRFGVVRDGKTTIEIPATHELIAESVNLARESVSRQIEKLEKSGLVSYDRGHIRLDDAEALSREFSEPISLDLWGLSADK